MVTRGYRGLTGPLMEPATILSDRRNPATTSKQIIAPGDIEKAAPEGDAGSLHRQIEWMWRCRRTRLLWAQDRPGKAVPAASFGVELLRLLLDVVLQPRRILAGRLDRLLAVLFRLRLVA